MPGGSTFEHYIQQRRKSNIHKKEADREASGIIDLRAEHQKIKLAEAQLYRPFGEVRALVPGFVSDVSTVVVADASSYGNAAEVAGC